MRDELRNIPFTHPPMRPIRLRMKVPYAIIPRIICPAL